MTLFFVRPKAEEFELTFTFEDLIPAHELSFLLSQVKTQVHPLPHWLSTRNFASQDSAPIVIQSEDYICSDGFTANYSFTPNFWGSTFKTGPRIWQSLEEFQTFPNVMTANTYSPFKNCENITYIEFQGSFSYRLEALYRADFWYKDEDGGIHLDAYPDGGNPKLIYRYINLETIEESVYYESFDYPLIGTKRLEHCVEPLVVNELIIGQTSDWGYFGSKRERLHVIPDLSQCRTLTYYKEGIKSINVRFLSQEETLWPETPGAYIFNPPNLMLNSGVIGIQLPEITDRPLRIAGPSHHQYKVTSYARTPEEAYEDPAWDGALTYPTMPTGGYLPTTRIINEWVSEHHANLLTIVDPDPDRTWEVPRVPQGTVYIEDYYSTSHLTTIVPVTNDRLHVSREDNTYPEVWTALKRHENNGLWYAQQVPPLPEGITYIGDYLFQTYAHSIIAETAQVQYWNPDAQMPMPLLATVSIPALPQSIEVIQSYLTGTFYRSEGANADREGETIQFHAIMGMAPVAEGTNVSNHDEWLNVDYTMDNVYGYYPNISMGMEVYFNVPFTGAPAAYPWMNDMVPFGQTTMNPDKRLINGIIMPQTETLPNLTHAFKWCRATYQDSFLDPTSEWFQENPILPILDAPTAKTNKAYSNALDSAVWTPNWHYVIQNVPATFDLGPGPVAFAWFGEVPGYPGQSNPWITTTYPDGRTYSKRIS